jgi:hypothetical protein
MLTRLVDEPTTLYVILGLVLFLAGTLWWKTGRKEFFLATCGALGLLVLALVLAHVIVTDAKRINASLLALTAGVDNKNLDATFAHVSNQFRHRTWDKAEFRRHAKDVLNLYEVQHIAIWDFEPLTIDRDNKTATVIFRASARGLEGARGVPFYNVKAHFVLDPDDQWRLKDFDLYLPTIDPRTNDSIELPF